MDWLEVSPGFPKTDRAGPPVFPSPGSPKSPVPASGNEDDHQPGGGGSALRVDPLACCSAGCTEQCEERGGRLAWLFFRVSVSPAVRWERVTTTCFVRKKGGRTCRVPGTLPGTQGWKRAGFWAVSTSGMLSLHLPRVTSFHPQNTWVVRGSSYNKYPHFTAK